MDDNKNLEGQVQQNQEPDNKPEEKEPTVEELMAQLAQERANSAKLQNDYNKASSEATDKTAAFAFTKPLAKSLSNPGAPKSVAVFSR